MPAAVVQQAADVVVAGNHVADCLAIEQFQLSVAVALPEALLGRQMPHLLRVEGGEYASVLQVALDVVAFDALTNDPSTLESHLSQQCCCVRGGAALDHVDVAAITVDDLPAVTSRGAEADLGRFEHGDPKAALQQEQRSGQAGIAGTDDAYIGFVLADQGGALRRRVGGKGVIGLRVGGVRHLATSVVYPLRALRSYARIAVPARVEKAGRGLRVKKDGAISVS
ncbi:hypothetical protein D3C78_883210 [compost metagenome]